MILRSILFVLASAAMVSSSYTQELDAAAQPRAGRQQSPFVSLSLGDIELVQYRPQHVQSNQLLMVVQNMMGRSLIVEERGSGARPLNNLSELGGQVIVYDTAEYAARVLQALKSLDAAPESPARETQSDESMEVMFEYTPRNVPVSSLGAALRSFGNLPYSEVGKRMISARVVKSRKDSLLAYMERIDQPDPSVLLTCYLLQAAEKSEKVMGIQPPSEVIASLNAILPGMEFRSIGFSMVQSTVSMDRYIELSIKAVDLKDYELKFMPLAFNQDSGDMTVHECEVSSRDREAEARGASAGPAHVLLRTDTVFRGNEYTVLGASGKDPVFIVIHSKRMR